MAVTSWQFFALLGVTVTLLGLAPAAARKIILIVASVLFYANASIASLIIIGLLIAGNFAVLKAILQTRGETVRDRIYLGSMIFNLAIFIAMKVVFEPAPGVAATSLTVFGLAVGYPLGLSFIILMLHSAVTDAHAGKYVPDGRFSTFALFALFFPYVSAGPVERLERMEGALGQPIRPTAEDLREGLGLILLGLVKKVVTANRIKPYVDQVFGGELPNSAPTMIFAIALNLAYIYADFSGYTDIARGAARCLGIKVSINFDKPLGSRSITEFWRRWHISFSTWLRDYLYMPIAFTLRRQGQAGVMASLIITFVICGFWHRGAWTFLLFGLLHGLAMVGEMKLGRPAPGLDKPVARRIHGAAANLYMLTFLAATLVLFSAVDLAQAGQIFLRAFTSTPIPDTTELFAYKGPAMFALMLAGLVVWQVLERWRARLTPMTTPVFIAVAALVLLFLGQPDGEGFVYAQF